jgi:hypothetical protein
LTESHDILCFDDFGEGEELYELNCKWFR